VVAEITVAPLTPQRFADLSQLFNEGGDPKWCWCMYFRKRGISWSNSSARENRAGLEALAEGQAKPGLVAYRDGVAVGWVSLGPRETYDRLGSSKVLAPLDDKPVWSIVCFVVSKSARGAGVASALIKAAVGYAREQGATTLEGYPVAADRGRVPAADAFHGTQSMFEKAGFVLAEKRQYSKTSPIRPIMRLDLEH
jgi:GNAT superfamily N-acetyltransferase